MPAEVVDVSSFATADTPSALRASGMAQGLIGSQILKIAADVRTLLRHGRQVCNLTVGDFDPKQFPIPERLRDAILDAYRRGETNYPPSNGVPELRDAVQRFTERELHLRYPLDSFIVASGARPVIYSVFRALVDPGDVVLFPVPSWNNDHYTQMSGAEPRIVACRAEDRFLPTRDALAPHLPHARLLCLNSPLNPSGTAFEPATLGDICDAVLAENRARAAAGRRPLFVLYDQIYWLLTTPGARHVTPVQLRPEMARWTVFVDGISKAFAATGLRVGWAIGPTDVMTRMASIIGHVGAWAPRAEQCATAVLLDDRAAVHEHVATMQDGILRRLSLLHAGLQGLRAEGLPVDSLPPTGTIYLTARFAPGARSPDGARLTTNEDVRRYLLDAAGFAVVPFQAFGVAADDGWFRLSVGAVSEADIEAALPRLATALRALR